MDKFHKIVAIIAIENLHLWSLRADVLQKPFSKPQLGCALFGTPRITYTLVGSRWSFTPLITPWVLPNRMVHSVEEMPSLSTGYRLVTGHTHATHANLGDDNDQYNL